MTLEEMQLIKKGNAKEAEIALNTWKKVLASPEWKQVTDYLEKRFIEISEDECDSLRKLEGRNARLDEIKRLFRHIKHDFTSKTAALRSFLEEQQIDDEDIPIPFIPYG